ncbi:MAG: icmO dotL [Francisellaceae bacterium]|nr:icmO dotL [Francisellaceae bacterium]
MIRGIESKNEQSARKLARDTRPLGTRAAEFIAKPEIIFSLMVTASATAIFEPMLADLMAFIFLPFYWFGATRKKSLPFRLPKTAQEPDNNDLNPGTGKPNMSGGISYFGNDRVTGEELWFTNEDLRTHVLIFGSTGSGKTEALLSIAYNSLIQASGFIYIDGKGDNSLFAKVFSMVRAMGREDDLLLINFMTGARDVLGPQKTRLSNTMNPFSQGSSSMLSQLVVSLMPGGQPGAGNDDMWKGRAINFVESLMKVLVAMRDAKHILLDANTIRDYFQLEKLEQMVVDRQFPITDTYSISLDTFPKQILEPLNSYVSNLPGYNRQKKGNQASEVREQHGFITMQLTRVFGSLADTYGHIIRTNLAEVDLKDVVLNRRIMVVLLPALEKSPEELANLGKIIIASLKAMMAAGLGDEVEGEFKDIVLRKPTNSPAPFTCIMDEYGYYAVQGFAVVPAQARSLGFSAVFAGQDLPAFQKASKEEAASIGANCNIKICMKLEDPQETWEFFNKVAGEAYVTSVSGFEMDAGSMTMNYLGNRNASIDRRQRIDLLDLKDQTPGEAHIFFRSKIVRARMFYASPKPVKTLRINQFLKIEPPTEKFLLEFDKRLKQFKEVFITPNWTPPELIINEDILILENSFDNATDDLKPYERGVAALIAVLEQEVARQREISAPYEQEAPTDTMSAFTITPTPPMVVRMIGKENQELFALPLIRKGNTLEEIKHIERLTGQSEINAIAIAKNLIQEIEECTSFPPEIMFAQDITGLKEDLTFLITILGGDLPSGEGASGHKVSAKTIESTDVDEDELPELFDVPTLAELPDLPDLDALEKLMNEISPSYEMDEEDDDEDNAHNDVGDDKQDS